MNQAKKPLSVWIIAVLALVAAACSAGQPVNAGDGDTSTSTTPSTAPSENLNQVEHDSPQPRALIASADDGEVEVLDLSTGEVVAHVETSGPVTLAPSSGGRLVLAGASDEGEVYVIDAGSWREGHGDHFHHYTSDPELLATFQGDRPSHLVAHDGLVALYFDGSGHTVVVSEDEILAGGGEPRLVVDAGLPHHGVSVPHAGHLLVSMPGGDSTELPVGVQIFHDDELEKEFAECPELHGEAVTGNHVAFACSEGILVVSDRGGWDTTTIEYPEVEDIDPFGYGAARAWSFVANRATPWLMSTFGTFHLLFTDVESAQAVAVEMESSPSIFGLAITEDGLAVVLTVDGLLQVIDPQAGAVLASLETIDAFEMDFSQPQPQLAVSSDRAYVTDPVSRTLIELVIDSAEIEIVRTLDLNLVPGSLLVVGG